MPSARVSKTISSPTSGNQRALLAEFCRIWSKRQGGSTAQASSSPPETGESAQREMAPRLRQTLDLLLAGDAEKQIARKLGLSPHTIHDYVKAVYRRFGVCSRAELLALWVKRD